MVLIQPYLTFIFFRYYADYHCPFNLKYFPFDIQKCQMIFKTRTATIAKIHFVPSKLTYSGPVDMIEFSLANYTVTSGVDGKVKIIQDHRS